MSKKIFSIKTLLAVCAAVCLSIAFGFTLQTNTKASAAESNTTAVEITQLKAVDDGASIMLSFSHNTDYMTTDWAADAGNGGYHWYLVDETNSFEVAEEDMAKYDSLGGQLAYEDSDRYNMPNAVLSKNLEKYNFLDYILVDGQPLRTYSINGEGANILQLVANKWTNVHTLAINIAGTTLFSTATTLEIKAGCTLPTMTYAFFGEGEFSALTIEEALHYKARNGSWVKAYPFDGYELGTEYDASEQYFYLRPDGSSYKGHKEAATCEFTDIFSRMGWGDDGYAIATTQYTRAGSIFVLDLVNPINVSEVGMIEMRVFSNVPRTLVSHNASEVTQESLGVTVEAYKVGNGFTWIRLMSELYADENGMIESLVFEFIDNGHEDESQNQFFVTSFSLGKNTINSIVYDESFFIQDLGDSYDLTMRFNKAGEFTGDEALDTSKVYVNKVSVDEMNANGANATARWSAIQGIYQINVNIPKAYEGAGQMFNAELGYTGNKMSVGEGLVFPNGDLLDRTYTCSIYGNEIYVEYEFIKHYEDTSVVNVKWTIDSISANNIHLYIEFDKKISSQVYYHACEKESWREVELPKYNLYDKEFTTVYLAGGFKSSLFDSIIINGKTLGEMHVLDSYTTCLLAQYGQSNSYTLDLSVDSNSPTYDELLPLFTEGNGVTLEIKSGFKFTTGIKTVKDAKFVLTNGKMVSTSASDDFKVFYDGKPVEDGAQLTSNTAAMESNVCVQGVKGYTITKTEEGNVVTFTVTYKDKTVSFQVTQELTPLPEAPAADNKGGAGLLGGCTSALSGGFAISVMLFALAAVVLMRKKNYEENQ